MVLSLMTRTLNRLQYKGERRGGSRRFCSFSSIFSLNHPDSYGNPNNVPCDHSPMNCWVNIIPYGPPSTMPMPILVKRLLRMLDRWPGLFINDW